MAKWQTQQIPFGCSATALATAVVVTTTGIVGAAVAVGKCDFWIDFTVADYSGGPHHFDQILLVVQANTLAAPTSWTDHEIVNLCIGDATARGSALTSVTNALIGCKNEFDNQIRLYAYVTGSALSATVTANIKPMV